MKEFIFRKIIGYTSICFLNFFREAVLEVSVTFPGNLPIRTS